VDTGFPFTFHTGCVWVVWMVVGGSYEGAQPFSSWVSTLVNRSAYG